MPRSSASRQRRDVTLSARHWAQLGLIAFIVFELWVASRGLEVYFGIVAPGIVMISLILRFGLTFPVGAFLYGLFILEWPAELAMLFAAPAILLMFPKLLPDIAQVAAWWRTRAGARSGLDRG